MAPAELFPMPEVDRYLYFRLSIRERRQAVHLGAIAIPVGEEVKQVLKAVYAEFFSEEFSALGPYAFEVFDGRV